MDTIDYDIEMDLWILKPKGHLIFLDYYSILQIK